MRFTPLLLLALAITLSTSVATGDPLVSPSPSASPSASASPAPSPSAPALYRFTPPAGWTPSATHGTFSGTTIVGAWRAPNAPGSSINLVDAPAAVTGDPATKLARIRQFAEAFVGKDNVMKVEQTRSCAGAEDAYYDELQFTMGANVMLMEQVIVFGPTHSYTATYGRLKNQPEDPVAHAALLTLCTSAPQTPV